MALQQSSKETDLGGQILSSAVACVIHQLIVSTSILHVWCIFFQECLYLNYISPGTRGILEKPCPFTDGEWSSLKERDSTKFAEHAGTTPEHMPRLFLPKKWQTASAQSLENCAILWRFLVIWITSNFFIVTSWGQRLNFSEASSSVTWINE